MQWVYVAGLRLPALGPAIYGTAALIMLENHRSRHSWSHPPPLLQVRTRDFKPMLATRPGLAALVKARALQTLADRMQQ